MLVFGILVGSYICIITDAITAKLEGIFFGDPLPTPFTPNMLFPSVPPPF